MRPRRPSGGVRFRGLLLVIAATLLSAGCDSDPSGPGYLTASIEGPEGPPGAALVLVTGEGIRGFVPGAAGHVHHERAGETLTSYRVIVVNPGEGPLEFRVEVDDVRGPRPAGRVLELADGENRLVDRDVLELFSVRFSR